MDGPQFVYRFTQPRTLGLLPLLAVVSDERGCVNTGASLCPLMSGHPGAETLVILCSPFWGSATPVHSPARSAQASVSPQPCQPLLLSLYLVVAKLVGVRRRLIVV